MTPKDIQRYYWLNEQRKWHLHRKKGRGWHALQAKWYNREINRLPGLMTWIAIEVFKEHSPLLIANVTKSNALLVKLKQRDPIHPRTS